MFRKMMLAGLMTATVLGGIAPAYAQRGDAEGRDWSRGRGDARGGADGGGRQGNDGQAFWRQQRGQDRPQVQAQPQNRPQVQPQAQRYESQQRVEQRSQAMRDRMDVRQQQMQQRVETQRANREAQSSWREQNALNDRARWQQQRDDRRDGRNDWRGDDRRRYWSNGNGPIDRPNNGGWNDRDRPDRSWNDRNWNDRRWDQARRYDDRTRWAQQQRWDNRWRNDRRYDWSSYRSRYGDRYRVGRYYAPRGWDYGYRRFSVGIVLSSSLYGNNYWLNDPYSYRLPPAYGTLRWIRYYDDALLVDVRDGYVVDAIHDFFW